MLRKGDSASRYLDGGAGVHDALATRESVRGVHRDPTHGVLSEMLSNLEHEANLVILHLQRAHDGRQIALELHVHDGADDLRH